MGHIYKPGSRMFEEIYVYPSYGWPDEPDSPQSPVRYIYMTFL